MESGWKEQEGQHTGTGRSQGSDSAKFWPADPQLAMTCGRCSIVRPSTNNWPLLAADGDPGESDDDPGMDDLADQMMDEPVSFPPEFAPAPASGDGPDLRSPPRRKRRASVGDADVLPVVPPALPAPALDESGARAPDESRGEDEDSLVQSGVYGKRKPKTLSEPYVPTQAEIDEHNANHLPWRSWCRACVGGGAVAHPHHPAPDDPEGARLPHFLTDYFFIGAGRK